MSDLFTVKLDLSSVTDNANERLYILLLDPTKMKMIYQFKLWIRFLFSFDCSIKLVYEDAVIHDLEDTSILKLLKTVRVERADSAVGEREQQEELISKLNRYEEWRESVTPAITPQKQCQIMNGDSFQSTSVFHDVGLPKIKSNRLSMPNERAEKQGRNENALQYSPSTSSQRTSNVKHDNRYKSRSTDESFNISPRSIPSDEMEIGKCVSNESSHQKHSTPQTGDTPKPVAHSTKTSNGISKQQASSKRKPINKPFSLYNFLQTLKGQESNCDETNQENTAEVDKNEIPDKKGEIYKNEEEGEQVIKRKRKRVRKHKNQKFKVTPHAEFCIETISPQFQDKPKFTSTSISPKPKHIRFNADEESRGFIMSKPKEDVNDHINECHYNSGPELSNDLKVDMITSNPEVDYVGEANNGLSVTVEINNKNIQENGENDFVAKEASMAGDDEDVKNKSLIDSSRSILDTLASLKKKTNTPPVFDRFATCV